MESKRSIEYKRVEEEIRLARFMHERYQESTCKYEELPHDSWGRNSWEIEAQRMRRFIKDAGYLSAEYVKSVPNPYPRIIPDEASEIEVQNDLWEAAEKMRETILEEIKWTVN